MAAKKDLFTDGMTARQMGLAADFNPAPANSPEGESWLKGWGLVDDPDLHVAEAFDREPGPLSVDEFKSYLRAAIEGVWRWRMRVEAAHPRRPSLSPTKRRDRAANLESARLLRALADDVDNLDSKLAEVFVRQLTIEENPAAIFSDGRFSSPLIILGDTPMGAASPWRPASINALVDDLLASTRRLSNFLKT
jgi:hypothetical protein